MFFHPSCASLCVSAFLYPCFCVSCSRICSSVLCSLMLTLCSSMGCRLIVCSRCPSMVCFPMLINGISSHAHQWVAAVFYAPLCSSVTFSPMLLHRTLIQRACSRMLIHGRVPFANPWHAPYAFPGSCASMLMHGMPPYAHPWYLLSSSIVCAHPW